MARWEGALRRGPGPGGYSIRLQHPGPANLGLLLLAARSLPMGSLSLCPQGSGCVELSGCDCEAGCPEHRGPWNAQSSFPPPSVPQKGRVPGLGILPWPA